MYFYSSWSICWVNTRAWWQHRSVQSPTDPFMLSTYRYLDNQQTSIYRSHRSVLPGRSFGQSPESAQTRRDCPTAEILFISVTVHRFHGEVGTAQVFLFVQFRHRRTPFLVCRSPKRASDETTTKTGALHSPRVLLYRYIRRRLAPLCRAIS